MTGRRSADKGRSYQAMPTIGSLSGLPPCEPKKVASPKLKMQGQVQGEAQGTRFGQRRQQPLANRPMRTAWGYSCNCAHDVSEIRWRLETSPGSKVSIANHRCLLLGVWATRSRATHTVKGRLLV